MSDIQQVVKSIETSSSIPRGRNAQQETSEQIPNSAEQTIHKEKNFTDPEVCHDPIVELEGIVRPWANQNKVEMEDQELSANNKYDNLRVEGIMYPLIVINDRSIEHPDILYVRINYKSFLPTIEIKIFDDREHELKINSTQMSGKIRLCMVSTIDKIYKKILLNFKITSSVVNPSNTKVITYYGEYYVPLFRQTNLGHIWMPTVCPKPITCQQGGHINANTWEMLHKIAEMTGLGFAATKQCKEISDRAVRNVYTQRFDEYIYDQLSHSGLGKENIFDAWVDLYGYIVMVNLPWIMSQDINHDDLDIVAATDVHGTSNDLPEQNPQTVERTLTNFNLTGAITNLEIESYSIETSNSAVSYGTLEHIYIINFVGTKTELIENDIQSKQHSVDGEFIEDYNTGMNSPIPKFNFNSDEYTEFSGGYDLDEQKKIRDAYFRKLHQSVLTITLRHLNFGLQRGTLVNIVIVESDPGNKDFMLNNFENTTGANDNIEKPKSQLPPEMDEKSITFDQSAWIPNAKLTGLYYIEGMTFIYSKSEGRIIQQLSLLKKGPTTGYHNRHTAIKVNKDIEMKPTLSQSPGFIEEYKNNRR